MYFRTKTQPIRLLFLSFSLLLFAYTHYIIYYSYILFVLNIYKLVSDNLCKYKQNVPRFVIPYKQISAREIPSKSYLKSNTTSNLIKRTYSFVFALCAYYARAFVCLEGNCFPEKFSICIYIVHT